jgi:hypothetical protein
MLGTGARKVRHQLNECWKRKQKSYVPSSAEGLLGLDRASWRGGFRGGSTPLGLGSAAGSLRIVVAIELDGSRDDPHHAVVDSGIANGLDRDDLRNRHEL